MIYITYDKLDIHILIGSCENYYIHENKAINY